MGPKVHRVLKAIQERKIDRVAAAYAVAAWILVQAASIGLPTFGAPAWVMKVIILATLVGFPLALWVTWHVTAPAHATADETSAALRRTDMVLLGVLTVLVLLVGAQFSYQLGAFRGKQQAIRTSAPPSVAMHATAGPPPTSIAVLPFLNLSGDPKKEFFSDGISEELLNDLANAPKLRVAARTSCFAFKGKNEDIRKIAQALNVRAILEGSVREDGQHIRITAQLINAADGYHIWSKTYDRDLSNILQVQDEIAQAITAALTHTLGGGSSVPPKPSRPAIDPDAYRDYLKAQALSGLKTDEGDAQAVELFKSVTAREPDFAPAFAALGRTYVHMAEFHDQRADFLESASAALKTALQLDSRNLDALSADLRFALMKWDWNAANVDARRLWSISPHSVFTVRGLAFYYSAFGFTELQAAAWREATRLDPLSFVDLNNLATAYANRGEFAKAVSAANDSLGIRPGRPLVLYTLCSAYSGMKQLENARAIGARLAALDANDASDGCAFKIAIASRNFGEAQALAARLAKRFPAFVFDETEIGTFYAEARDYRTALSWLERAYRKRNWGLFSLRFSVGIPTDLLETMGWRAIMSRPEARAWQDARDRAAIELAKN